MNLKEIIDYTEKNQEIIWNNSDFIYGIDEEYKKYLTNFSFPQGKVCGYFTLIHNVIKNLPEDAIIVELGNREGMSTLAIYDSLKPKQKFYTIDIVQDLRLLPKKFFEDDRVNIVYDNCTNPNVLSMFLNNSIDFLFSDTIHHYHQISKEFDVYKNKMKNNSLLFVDDIKINDKGKFFDEWIGEKYSLDSWAHESGFGCFKIKN
jgi:predicted O-methyltransferase YrrM